MTASPLIGITTYAANENHEVTLPANYISAVRRAGGVPVLIAPGETQTVSLFDRLDGIVLAGGGDICPSCYGGDQHDAVYMVDAERDRMELELARLTIDRGMPTLAICRGIQIINVMLGGTLHNHLPDVVGESVLHRAPPREPIPHPVEVEQGSRVAATMEATHIEPMSWHHQAIHQVAEPLSVVARAPDGIVEAVEMPDHPWLLCVQWHPEITADRDMSQQRLFEGLVRQATSQGD